MARRSNVSISLKFQDIEGVAEDLDGIDPTKINETIAKGVDATGRKVFTDSKDKITSRVNLTRGYVEERMDYRPATFTAGAIRAEVLAPVRFINLIRYDAKPMVAPTNWTNQNPSTKRTNPRKPGSPLPWKPRVGNSNVGGTQFSIPVGQKQIGVTATVLRAKGLSELEGTFLIRGKGNNPIVARLKKGTGKKGGKVEGVISPSVHQLFRASLTPDYLGTVTQTLTAEVNRVVFEDIAKVFR